MRDDPRYIICGEGAEANAELMFLNAGESVTVSPSIDINEDYEYLELKTSGVFPIIRNDKRIRQVDILVSCFGFCSILREDVEYFLRHRGPLPRVYSGSITTLGLTIPGEPDETLLYPLYPLIR